MAWTSDSWVRELGLATLRPPVFFRCVDDINHAQPPHPQAHSMRRAWQEMKLDGILCFDNAPVVYFRSRQHFDEHSVVELHRQVWNQGIAPILIVVSETSVNVFSGLAVPARQNELLRDKDRLVETLDRTADALAVRDLIRRIELGDLFSEHGRCFDPKRRVDRHLLDNLAHARRRLSEVESPMLDPVTIHALLGRLIFICYLVDRKIISRDYFAECGAHESATLLDLLREHPRRQAKERLYRLFRKLQDDFNGDLFDADLDAEARRVGANHVEVLRRFLSDEDLATGQMSLGFSAYDFRFIPIETISAIYERFLDAEDGQGRRETGAYYTPRFLAEVVLDLAMEGMGSALGRRFLDASCGSGIFLVGLFNRLAEEWRARNPDVSNLKRASELIELLTQSIFGIDLSETACRIASLSLYLALLDQLSPRDIQQLQAKGRALPKLVAHSPPRSTDEGRNILNIDFFGASLDLPAGGFDLVVGNPPWARAKGPPATAEVWCDDRDRAIAQRQLAYAFMWKAPTHLRNGGRVCLVLPAATLFNHQEKALRFQEQWLACYAIDVIVNLSDLVFYLFDGADRPAIIARYRAEQPSASAYVPYVVPKTELETLRAEVLSISNVDRSELRLADLLRDLKGGEPPLAWKQAMWATARGRKFLDRLREYATVGDRINETHSRRNGWVFGEGFNLLGKGRSIDRPILHTLPFLPTRAVSYYVVSERQVKANPRAYNPRYIGKEKIFSAPHVVFPHGVPRTGERLKVAFCPFACSFEHSLRGIHAPPRCEDDLRFLTCALGSPLALYFFFHTAANWGTERAKIHVAEYERFPFPAADTAERRNAMREAVALHRHLQAENESNPFFQALVEQRRYLLDDLVYEYYEIDAAERLLITDTVDVWIPSATPTRGVNGVPALDVSLPARRDQYARVLVQTLTSWITRRGQGLTAKVIISTTTSLGIVQLTLQGGLAGRIEGEQASSAALDKALARIQAVLPAQRRTIRQMRDLKVFDGCDLYVIKPLATRYWTDTAALNDADEIMAGIVRSMDSGH
ncbi:MAG: class I SAM-dependent DNA methyltransferase [Candidatus Binatia bacterium]